MHKYITVIIAALFLAGCGKSGGQIRTTNAFPNLSFSQPVDLQSPRDGSNRLFVVSQAGEILVFNNDSSVTSAEIFLDIKNIVKSGGEQGLLGLAFHPRFDSNGYFYINYTSKPNGNTTVARYSVSATDPGKADPLSQTIILTAEQPYSNHNAGCLQFGPDGYLYIGMGDGGSGGDPLNHAQNRSTLLGSMLRINVDIANPPLNYSIPEDNPYRGNTDGFREEIWAYGLRNPWRYSFDFQTGRLWLGDVGQNAYEEINILESGKNYGWRIMEGFHCFNPPNCDTAGLTLPVFEYPQGGSTGRSVTGGIVYRGAKIPSLYGSYIYGDFVSGNVWALSYDGKTATENRLLFNIPAVASFGTDDKDGFYIISYLGTIHKITEDNPSGVGMDKRTDFKLHQNFPNPFNPSTTIRFEVPESPGGEVFVTLKVFNLLGQEVAVLVDNKSMPAGFHSSFFIINSAAGSAAGGLSSGIFFYRLTVSSGGKLSSLTKKMTLLK